MLDLTKYGGIYKFVGNPVVRCFKFEILQSHQLKKFETYELSVKDEEKLFYTLSWFDKRKPIRCYYTKTSNTLTLFLHPDDKQYMLYYIALEKRSIVFTNFNVETQIPFLLKGIIYGNENVYTLCFAHIVKMISSSVRFPSSSFRFFDTNINDLEKSVSSDYFRIRHYFDNFLKFLDDAIKRKLTDVVNLDKGEEGSAFFKSFASFVYFLFMKTKSNFSNDTVVNVKGSVNSNHIFKACGYKLDRGQEMLTCTLEDISKMYALIFTNTDYKTFLSFGAEVELKYTVNKRIIKAIVCSRNFNSDGIRNVNKHKKKRLDELKEKYQFMAYTSKKEDSRQEKDRSRGLLVLLDTLSLHTITEEEREKYSKKTFLYTYLSDVIERGCLKDSKLFVPVVEECQMSKREFYSDIQYVLPFYDVHSQWDMEKVINKNFLVKENRFFKNKDCV